VKADHFPPNWTARRRPYGMVKLGNLASQVRRPGLVGDLEGVYLLNQTYFCGRFCLLNRTYFGSNRFSLLNRTSFGSNGLCLLNRTSFGSNRNLFQSPQPNQFRQQQVQSPQPNQFRQQQVQSPQPNLFRQQQVGPINRTYFGSDGFNLPNRIYMNRLRTRSLERGNICDHRVVTHSGSGLLPVNRSRGSFTFWHRANLRFFESRPRLRH
jgi:hypothetical protein